MLSELFKKGRKRRPLSDQAAELIKQFEVISAEVDAIPDAKCDEEDRQNIASIKMTIGIAMVNLGLIVGTTDEDIDLLGLTDKYQAALSESTLTATSIRALLNAADKTQTEV